MSENAGNGAGEPAKESVGESRRDPLAAPVRVLHPALLALQPVVGLYANNAGKTPLSELIRPSLILVGGAIILSFLLRLWTHERHRAGVMASLIIVAMLTGWKMLEYVIRLVTPVGASFRMDGLAAGYILLCAILLTVYVRMFAGRPGIYRNAVILVGLVVALAVAADTVLASAFGTLSAALIAVYLTFVVFAFAALLRYDTAYENWTQTLNWFAGVLLGLYLLLAVGNIWRLPPEAKSPGSFPVPTKTATADEAKAPDIYFISLEGYARGDVLQRTYGYNPAPFLDGMRAQGFQVVPESRSNYALSLFSLTSTLNMDFLQDVIRTTSPKHNPFAEILAAYHRNKVYAFLKSRGYSLQVIAPGSEALDPGSNVDVQIRPARSMTEFERVLAKGSVAGRLSQLAHYLRSDTKAILAAAFIRERVGFAFESLNRIAATTSKRPRFIFASLPMPGGPYFAYDRDGQLPDCLRTEYGTNGEFIGTVSEYKQAYVEQVIYLNKRLAKTAKTILSNAKRPVVILVASGNGPWFESATLSDRLPVADRFSNLILAYLPPEFGGQKPLFDSSTTLVNVFPVLFNRVFGTELPLHPDTVFVSKPAKPFDFSPATWATE